MKVNYFRISLLLPNGTVENRTLRVGLTDEGTLVVPASKFGLGDEDVSRCKGCPHAPVVVEADGTIYLDIQHVIDFFQDETSKRVLRQIRDRLVRELPR